MWVPAGVGMSCVRIKVAVKVSSLESLDIVRMSVRRNPIGMT